MTPSLHLRIANLADATAIAEVNVAAWRVAYVGLLPDRALEDLSVEKREAMFSSLLRGPHRFVVAEEGARVAGFVSYGSSRDPDATPSTGEIHALYVRPELWGRRTGRALLDRARADLESMAFDRATLWVLEGNARARRFYEASGWACDGEIKVEHRFDLPVREIRYRCTLTE